MTGLRVSSLFKCAGSRGRLHHPTPPSRALTTSPEQNGVSSQEPLLLPWTYLIQCNEDNFLLFFYERNGYLTVGSILN